MRPCTFLADRSASAVVATCIAPSLIVPHDLMQTEQVPSLVQLTLSAGLTEEPIDHRAERYMPE